MEDRVVARMGRWTRIALAALASAAALLLGAEAVFFVASALAARPPVSGDCAVLVLGYPANSDGSPNETQAVRVAAGVDAWRRNRCGRIVLSGGAAHNAFVEADVMAGLARDQGVPAAQIAAEDHARNTWENVEYSLPLLDGFAHLFIASEPLHAYRGRRYLCRQRPDWCGRVALAPAYVPFTRPWWKAGAVLYELAEWMRDRVRYG